jgi:transcriptional regulator with XRE-family HTH domain
VPAVEYIRASIARELIRDRKAAGLSQSELGKLAGVRQETISRVESGKHTVSPRVMASIERALLSRQAATGRRKGKRTRGR